MKRAAHAAPCPAGVATFLAAAVAFGCSSAPETTIVVTVEQDPGIGVPTSSSDADGLGDFDRLVVTIRSEEPYLRRKVNDYVVRPRGWATKPGEVVLPAQLEIVSGPSMGGTTLTVTAELFLGEEIPIVSRAVRVTVVGGTSTPVTLRLDRTCVGLACPEGNTCLPGKGCIEIPDASDVDGSTSAAHGPPCNCDSFLPFCVGAWSTHVFCSGFPQTQPHLCEKKDQDPKANAVVEFDAGAFLHVRVLGNERARKWLSRDDTLDDKGKILAYGQRTMWLREEHFNFFWQPTASEAYTPPKLRLDEGRGRVGAVAVETYLKTKVGDGTPEAPAGNTVVLNEDTWTVVPIGFLLPGDRPVTIEHELEKSDVFKWGITHQGDAFRQSILCHHRHSLDFAPGDAGGTVLDDKSEIFCFARGIGKIWEATLTKGTEEFLQCFSIPGCPALPGFEDFRCGP